MIFARHLSLASILLLLVGCASEPAPNPAPAPTAAVPAGTDPAEDRPVAPEPPSNPPPETPGPSFVVQPDKLSIEHPLRPGGQSSSYEAEMDETTLESGRPSMRLSSTDGATAKGFGATTAMRKIDASIVGHRYRMRAKIKTEDASGAWLWWRIDGGGFYQIDNMGNPVDRLVRGTKDWHEVSLVMEVPEDATHFAFGSGLTGPGSIWVSAITFESVSDDVPVTPSFGNGD